MNDTAVVDIAGDTDRPAWQATRLAELVFHLADCAADDALRAVNTPPADTRLNSDEALARVAAAIVAVKR